ATAEFRGGALGTRTRRTAESGRGSAGEPAEFPSAGTASGGWPRAPIAGNVAAPPMGAPSSTTRAIAVMLLAMFLFACMDAVSKYLSQTYAIAQILWVRYLFFLVFACLVARQRMPLSLAI